MTRIGLAGMGRWGCRWFDTIPDADLSVVLRKDRKNWGERSSLFTLDPAEFLMRCERVIVATPTDTHVGLVKAALKAGKSVLCEKPLAESYDDAELLIVTAARAATRLWVSYPHLWHPAVERMHADFATVAPGEDPIVGIDAELTFQGPTDREPLLDWGPHALSAALYLLGTDAQASKCSVSRDKRRAQILLESPRGKAWCTFGDAAMKTTRIALKAPERRFYTGETCSPTTLERMLAAWVSGVQDGRSAPDLTLGVHAILEEAAR